ncbi:MAG: N-6 DNA methylase, partial [Gemmatimonadales bacterium]|nr:N-6 DNA methylase [Gemmatimonadales bacterium]
MGRIAGVMVFDAGSRRLAVAVAFDHCPALELSLDAPTEAALSALTRLAASPGGGVLARASHAAEAISSQSAGRRFFREFRATLDRMAAAVPARVGAADRHAYALLQLVRVLFLYFIQTKGWLAGRDRFLAEEVDRCLGAGRRIQRDLLRPLFFGTLNRQSAERSRTAAAFGPIPFLNGGLFEPHPLERRVGADLPDDLWRDAFADLFERFHFTTSEGEGRGAVAPDMLGRVFEGVMDPVERRATGTFYTPAALVRQLVDAGLFALVGSRLGCGDAEAERRLDHGDPDALRVIGGMTILDPAVGSGAFLLGALERLAALAPTGTVTARKRRILQHNLFGVDRSATAVRLTELRLWLAVVADDSATSPADVAPLPNLDCLVRQGDSLFDPAGLGPGSRPSGPLAMRLANIRHLVVDAAGPEKQPLLRTLRTAESAALASAVAMAEAETRGEVAGCMAEARAHDLFGKRRGMDRTLRRQLESLRTRLRDLRRTRATVRAGELPWFHYQSQFADTFARGGFDLVVGNPPWLRAEDVPAELRARLTGRYRWWKGTSGGYGNRPDLAVAFLERAVELTAAGGAVAMLVPAKLATATYGSSARHALATETRLHVVADLSGEPAAAFDATVYPLALVASKTASAPGARVRTRLGTGAIAQVGQSALVGGAPWVLSGDPARRALNALGADHPPLADRFICHLGAKTGANRIFLDPPDDIEPELIRHAVRGREIRPFRVADGPRLLWTHAADGSPLRALPPIAAAYLATHTAVLRARSDQVGGPLWSLFRTRPAGARHRVLWADLARRLEAVALGTGDEDRIPLNSCYVITARSDAEATRLAAWLNLTWIRAAARLGATPASNGYARFNSAVVSRLPLPPEVLTDSRLLVLGRTASGAGDAQDVQAEL